MKRLLLFLAVGCIVLLAACGNRREVVETTAPMSPSTTVSAEKQEPTPTAHEEQQQEEQDMTLKMMIGSTPVAVSWEDNDAVEALKALCQNAPLTIPMSMYGGFEQVGSIGAALPQDDVQTTTSAGDIVLYAGDQLVVFYGSNTWAYTRLGHISDQTEQELTALLSNGDVTITLTL